MSETGASDRTSAAPPNGGRGGPDLRDRATPLTADVVAEMTRTVTAFANAPAPFLDVVAIVVGRIVEQVLTLFVELRPATRAEVRELVEVCVPPTAQGITLEDMLRVFAIAQTTLWDELHRAADDGRIDEPAVALDLGEVGATLIAELSRGVTSEYLRGERVWLQRRDAERALVRGVLDAPPRMEEATRSAHALGLRLFGVWRCAAYEPLDDGTDAEQLLATLEDSRATWGVEGALAIEGRTVLLLTQQDEPLPPPTNVRVGIGDRHPGAQGLRTSHDEALDALAVARLRGALELTVDDARIGRVVLGSLSAKALADEVLAPLDAQPEGRRAMLAETLEAWLDEQGSPSAVAARLQLHVQSARYRIEQLRDVFGPALDDPERRLQLHLAAKARSLDG